MSDDLQDQRTRLSRRRLLAAGAAGVAVAGGGAIVASERGRSGDVEPALRARALPAAAAGLPAAQHEWESRLARDPDGNPVAPPHQRVLLFALAQHPTAAGATWIEAALRRVDALQPTVFTVLGWSHAWFAHTGLPAPIPAAKALSDTESPELDGAIAALHLGAGDPATLEAVDLALTHGAALPGGRAGEVDLRPVLRLVERRVGFVGAGLPAQHVSELTTQGGVHVPASSPLFMGFKSGMRKNQASEASVTIDSGRWRGGTTMHVSDIALTLPSWYSSLDESERVARMHGPGVSVHDAQHPGDGLDPPTTDIEGTARRYGVVGHTQTSATARRRGKPVILRRDFNGVVDGQPRVHFVALARTIEDFEATRRAMNADRASSANPTVGAQINNGINEWLAVHARANFLVPTRAARAFPGLPGTTEAA